MTIKAEIIVSIHPKWCEKIFSGEKDIELRKTYPSKGYSFKAYIYETKPGEGAVIGEILVNMCWKNYRNRDDDNSCLTDEEIQSYGNGKAYGWHIIHFEKYDQPKLLSDFGLTRAPQSWCYSRL